MKALLVSNVYPTGEGVGTPSIKIQAELLKGKGVEIDVYVIETGNKLAYLKAVLHFLRMNLQKKKYDLVHSYYGLSGFAAVMQRRIPVVATFLGSDILAEGTHNDRDRRFSMVAVRHAQAVIMMTEEMKKNAGREDAYVIPFGVHLPDFPLEDQRSVRAKLGLDFDKKYILFPWDPSRLVKRFDIVTEVMHRLEKRTDDVEVLVVYNRSHQEMVDYMNACDAILMVSDHEGSPVAIREAMACNLPVLSVAVGDVPDLIKDVDNCYLVGRDPSGIASALEIVLSSSRRSNGREKMQAYDMISATEQVYSIYQAILHLS